MNQTTTNRIEFIDFARGYSILTIVLMHYLMPLNFNSFFEKAIQFGGAGVHLFIFLSGFSLNLSRNQTVFNFYKTRFVKILIPYYLFISFLFFFNLLFPIYKDGGLSAYLGHLFLFKMFNEDLNVSLGYHFWFISTIVQFYLSYPLLVRLRNRTGNIQFVLITLFCSMGWWVLLFFTKLYEYRIWNSFFLQFLWEFALGMFFCELYKNKNFLFWKIKCLWLFLIAFGGISVMGLITIQGNSSVKIFNDIPSFLGYTSLCILIYQIIKKYLKLFNRCFLYIGTISYPLYLVHGWVIAVISDVFYKVHMDFTIYLRLMTILIALVAAYLFYKFSNRIAKIFSGSRI